MGYGTVPSQEKHILDIALELADELQKIHSSGMLLVSDRLLALNSELQQLEIFARQAREQIASRCVAGSRTRTVFQDEIERLDVERSPSDTGDFGNCGSWVPRIKLEDADNDKTGSASLATANWLNYSEEAEGYQLSRSRPKEVCQVLSDTSIECLPIREHETTGRPETFQVAESLEMQQIGSGHTQPSVARPFPYRAEVALHRPPTHFSHIQQNKLTDYQGKTLENYSRFGTACSSILDTLSSLQSPQGYAPSSFLRLTGYSFPRRSSTYDLFLPEVHEYQAIINSVMEYKKQHEQQGNASSVQPLDVRCVWKGLRISDAEELLLWEAVFRSSLEIVVTQRANTGQDKVRLASFQPAGYNPAHSGGSACFQDVEVDEYELASVMRALWNNIQEMGRQHPSVSSISQFILDFIRTRDCFAPSEQQLPVSFYDESSRNDSLGHSSVSLRLLLPRSDHTGSSHQRLTAEIRWNPPVIVIDELDVSPREGSTFRLVPRISQFSSPLHEPSSVTQTLSIDPPTSWLVWDEVTAGFKGTIPVFSEHRQLPASLQRGIRLCGGSGSENDTRILRFEIRALIVHNFSHGVRFERTIRTQVNISVLPWYAHEGSHRSNLVLRKEADRLGHDIWAFPHMKSYWHDPLRSEDVVLRQNSLVDRPSLTANLPCGQAVDAFGNGPSTLEQRGTFDMKYDFMSILLSHKQYLQQSALLGPRKQVDDYFENSLSPSPLAQSGDDKPCSSTSIMTPLPWPKTKASLKSQPSIERSTSKADFDEQSASSPGILPLAPTIVHQLRSVSPTSSDSRPMVQHIEHAYPAGPVTGEKPTFQHIELVSTEDPQLSTSVMEAEQFSQVGVPSRPSSPVRLWLKQSSSVAGEGSEDCMVSVSQATEGSRTWEGMSPMVLVRHQDRLMKEADVLQESKSPSIRNCEWSDVASEREMDNKWVTTEDDVKKRHEIHCFRYIQRSRCSAASYKASEVGLRDLEGHDLSVAKGEETHRLSARSFDQVQAEVLRLLTLRARTMFETIDQIRSPTMESEIMEARSDETLEEFNFFDMEVESP